jgi:hypothetical protein
MASFTFTIDDTKLPRWHAAYGTTTPGQLKAAIIVQARQPVIGYEITQVTNAEDSKVQAARDSAESALQAARAKAESEISVN